MNVIIPRLTMANFIGYHPVFNKPIKIAIKNNLFIILEGNGLGKTILLQSTIYGLGGPLDAKIESATKKRWGRQYFIERLDNYESALVEIEFFIGEDKVLLKRGFRTDKLLEFHLSGKLITDKSNEANKAFEDYLQQTAG